MNYRVPDHVDARWVHDEVVIFDGRTNTYLGLNGSGAVVWSCLGGGGSVADAVAGLTACFEVTPEVARADATALLGELLRRGLLTPVAP